MFFKKAGAYYGAKNLMNIEKNNPHLQKRVVKFCDMVVLDFDVPPESLIVGEGELREIGKTSFILYSSIFLYRYGANQYVKNPLQRKLAEMKTVVVTINDNGEKMNHGIQLKQLNTNYNPNWK